jgi:pathogenesis-related protein 1
MRPAIGLWLAIVLVAEPRAPTKLEFPAAKAPVSALVTLQPPGSQSLSRAAMQEMLLAHNAWRKKSGAPALRWAADLAAQARNRARQLAGRGCIIEHGLLAEELGENLYRAGPLRAAGRDDAVMAVSPDDVVDAWGAESADYSPASGACAPGRQCGHYTQIVWPSTEEVGCGMDICPSLGQIWVCLYRPKGNVRILR